VDDRKNLPVHETLIRRLRATAQNQFAEFTEEKLLYHETRGDSDIHLDRDLVQPAQAPLWLGSDVTY
jgi:hypothetical protein